MADVSDAAYPGSAPRAKCAWMKSAHACARAIQLGVSRGFVQGEKRGAHGERVAEERAGRAGLVVAKPAAGERPVADHPGGSLLRLAKRLLVRRPVRERAEGRDRPPVLPGVAVGVDAGDPAGAAAAVVQREEFPCVLAGHKVGVLARVESAVAAAQESLQVGPAIDWALAAKPAPGHSTDARA